MTRKLLEKRASEGLCLFKNTKLRKLNYFKPPTCIIIVITKELQRGAFQNHLGHVKCIWYFKK